jgi:hypothetical protein
VGGAERGQTLGAEQRFGSTDFALALLQLRVRGIRPTFLANLLQSQRVDGQRE